MEIDINQVPNAKFQKIIEETVTVILGTTTKKTWNIPSRKMIMIHHIIVQQSQLLQTIAKGDLRIDDEPCTAVVSASSTSQLQLQKQLKWADTGTINALLNIEPIPARRKIEITFTSTAVGNGTAVVEVWGYVIDDDDSKFYPVSQIARILSV